MKKKKIFEILFMLAILVCGCQKKELLQGRKNVLISEITNEKATNTYIMFALHGHDEKDCEGCAMIGGRWVHLDCHADGNKCQTSARIILNPVDGGLFTATTTDTFSLTNRDFFAMPDRSFYYEDDNKDPFYLNIPEQLVYRDSTTLQFTFTGLYITNSPAYSND